MALTADGEADGVATGEGEAAEAVGNGEEVAAGVAVDVGVGETCAQATVPVITRDSVMIATTNRIMNLLVNILPGLILSSYI